MSELEFMEIFADNLREIMQERRMTQHELARESDITQATISRYLTKKQMPSIKAVVNFSYALRCDIKDLIDFGDMII